jgi:hypothetical protein
VSVCRLQKRVGRDQETHGCGRDPDGERGRFGGGGGTVPIGGAHETERAGERMGSRVDERACVTKRDGSRARRKLVLTSRPHWVERGRESMRGMVLTVRLSGRGGHARVGARIGFWPS